MPAAEGRASETFHCRSCVRASNSQTTGRTDQPVLRVRVAQPSDRAHRCQRPQDDERRDAADMDSVSPRETDRRSDPRLRREHEADGDGHRPDHQNLGDRSGRRPHLDFLSGARTLPSDRTGAPRCSASMRVGRQKGSARWSVRGTNATIVTLVGGVTCPSAAVTC